MGIRGEDTSTKTVSVILYLWDVVIRLFDKNSVSYLEYANDGICVVIYWYYMNDKNNKNKIKNNKNKVKNKIKINKNKIKNNKNKIYL